ncbi:hypothetical protein [Halochromatium roseum]|uniref:hypothetical protein n=1 Tax=Halochromatium roseum TaxID=391920 RepID=UPI0019148415|nr:hypothetical protein [Halochromatium roseum]
MFEPLAHAILLAGEEFPGGVARVFADPVEDDDSNAMPAPEQVIDAFPGGGLQAVAAREPFGIARGDGIV